MKNDNGKEEFIVPNFIRDSEMERKDRPGLGATKVDKLIAQNLKHDQEITERWNDIVYKLMNRCKKANFDYHSQVLPEMKYKSLILTEELGNRELSAELKLNEDGEVISLIIHFPFRIHFHALLYLHGFASTYNLRHHENPGENKDEMYVDAENGKIYLQRNYYLKRVGSTDMAADQLFDAVICMLEEGFDYLYGELDAYSVGKLNKEEKELYASLLEDSLSVLKEEWDDKIIYGLSAYKNYLKAAEMSCDCDEESEEVEPIVEKTHPIQDERMDIRKILDNEADSSSNDDEKEAKEILDMFADDPYLSDLAREQMIDKLIKEVDMAINALETKSKLPTIEGFVKNREKRNQTVKDDLFDRLLESSNKDESNKKTSKDKKDGKNNKKDKEENDHDD